MRERVGTRLFVGNLAFETKEQELKDLFSRVGTCLSAVIVMDRATARPRGFGFVEMENEQAARRALSELNGAELNGRGISVSEARERSASGPGAPAIGAAPAFRRPQQNFGPDRPPAGQGFRKGGKSRRGVRGRKRSL